MLKYGCKYIGIGGLVAVQPRERREWLDDLFLRLCDKDGFPTVKTHGFGMTAMVLMFRYPWYSVDSTKWVQTTANGEIFLPHSVDGEFLFDQMPSTIAISAKHANSVEGRPQADQLTPAHRQLLDKWLDFCGTSYEDCRTSYFNRALVNVSFFREVGRVKALKPFKPYTVKQQGLL
jgi:hypothetical protein